LSFWNSPPISDYELRLFPNSHAASFEGLFGAIHSGNPKFQMGHVAEQYLKAQKSSLMVDGECQPAGNEGTIQLRQK